MPAEFKLTGAQLECLSSPVRVDLYEAIRLRQRASVAELAADVKKSVHSLYYHIKSLTKVGLIRVCAHRRVGKRVEAIYEVVSDRLLINKEDTSPIYIESLIKTVRLALRKAEREHRGARREEVPSDQIIFLRLQARLSPDDALKLQKKVAALGKWVRRRDQSKKSDAGTNQIAVTCLAVPVDSQT